MKPLVSVIIPLYNAADTIRGTVESVLRQTVKDFEIIIVNDGSRDDSLAVAQNLIEEFKDEKITLIDKPNGGASSARNAGMRKAQGSLIALLDADDEWLPDKLATQLEILNRHPDIDFLGTNRNDEHFKRFFFKKFANLTPISSRLLLYKNFFVTPTVIFKRSILDKVGYFEESQRYSEEGNFWIRVCKDHHCVLLNQSLVITGRNKPHFGFSGLSSNLREMERGELKNIRKAHELGVIGRLECYFALTYSYFKYLRRILIVKLRQK
ncbi:glycosyltransferase family A protein [uncultured Chitinophaga sp.]|jgi:Glycosyltransferases involved in cell wall biogenesis|uniref:glycosyltransferase family 2 protein n=1 Tax=uncultured Chitinophaga sp. TaxID=339340 RepID=UPI0026170622|nr:glycosyltransferase family A protein [uncultured Chitinophaga sp.]